MARQALGRGLGALIPEAASQNVAENEEVNKVQVKEIIPNPYQPRRYFDPERLAELSASIKEHGVLQPLIVRRTGRGYELVAGERRWRASQQAGLSEVPVVVRELNDLAMMKIALVENLQREDLNPLEEALAFQRLMKEFNVTQEEVANAVGKSRSTVANALRLLTLPAEIQESLAKGEITAGHARAILAVEGAEAQHKAWQTVLTGNLTVRQAENLRQAPPKKTGIPGTLPRINPEVKDMQDRLRERLGTKVQIQPGKDKGKIEIEYYGDDDLGRVIGILLDETGEN